MELPNIPFAVSVPFTGSAISISSANLVVREQVENESVRAIIESFYKAFNAAEGRDAAELLLSATSEDWVSCSGDNVCGTRSMVIPGIVGLSRAVPDLTWTVKDMIVAGDTIIVRGEAKGTPSGDFIGVPHGGRSFTFMSIDIHTIRDGKIVRTFHVEDMLGAQAQLMGR